MEAATRLKATKYFVQQQMPPSKSERKQFALPEFKALKEDTANTAKFRQEQLYVKNKLQSQYLPPSLPESPATYGDPANIAESKKKSDSGCSFKGYCAGVSTIQDVATLRQHISSLPSQMSQRSIILFMHTGLKVAEGRLLKILNLTVTGAPAMNC